MIDAANCPLCQKANACALEAKSDKPCWCIEQVFSPKVRSSIEQLGNRQACVCQACVKRLSLAHDVG